LRLAERPAFEIAAARDLGRPFLFSALYFVLFLIDFFEALTVPANYGARLPLRNRTRARGEVPLTCVA
jgi:hypothetical protein